MASTTPTREPHNDIGMDFSATTAKLYAQANKIIWDDAVGIFPFDLTENYVASKKVGGFTPPPSGIPYLGNLTLQR